MNNIEKKKEQILKEISDKQKELNELNNLSEYSAIIPLISYSNEEKLQFFDKLYDFCLAQYNYAKNEKYKDDDVEHYIYEEAFQILNIRYKNELWNYINKLF